MVKVQVEARPVVATAVAGLNGFVQTHSPQLKGALKASAPRTLVEIFEDSVAAYPDSSALDDGRACLSYTELQAEVRTYARKLQRSGIGAGHRVGVRIPSGTNELYVAILAVLFVGAAYVPVDADDPDERARLVFAEAGVSAVLGAGGIQDNPVPGGSLPEPRPAAPDDDAWIIFTSGSTGTPKGVAVTHRSAAAFVDAEARLFLQEEPLGPADRVLAGLSVAFDASCEEMWLAWRHGACLVPAPRALVKTGMDLGPWLVTKGITAVSTVPTLAALWPVETLDAVRLLIFGGEACPPELAARLAVQDRQVWNTYGPTETTVVACAALMDGSGPVRIGLPLDGWDLAVVDAEGIPVAEGDIGELIIGGVGLARYLDPLKDAEKFAAMDGLGWDRAYRSGDLVRYEREGLLFMGRADEQVKLGGRRIELGEVDSALQALPGIHGAAAAVKNTGAGHQVLVGYLAPGPGIEPDLAALRELLALRLPAALVPMLAVVYSLPVKTSGKVDRAALPWPLTSVAEEASGGTVTLDPVAAWIAEQWTAVLGGTPEGLEADFFAHGGGSLAAAQLVSALRTRYPSITVADIYSRPRLGALVELALASGGGGAAVPPRERTVRPTARRSQVFQVLISAPLHVLVGMRWLTYLMAGNNVLSTLGVLMAAPTVSWWWVLASWAVFVSPLGRMSIAAAAARILLRGVVPGAYPRSGKVHLRLWLAEQIADLAGAVSLAGAPWIPYYARALGAKIGPNVDLHSVPPVTGMLYLGPESSIEPEVDLSGWWIDGDLVHIGRIHVGRGATVGSRSTLMPGARVGAGAEVSPGSAVLGKVRANQHYAGSPAVRIGKARRDVPAYPALNKGSSFWFPAYAAGSTLLAGIPFCSVLAGASVVAWAVRGHGSLAQAWPTVLAAVPLAAAVWFIANLLLTAGVVRILGIGLKEGHYRVRSLTGWRIWATERVLDAARDLLFPIYASLFTPLWLRMLGAKVGRNVEASTVLLLPSMTTVGDGAFLADDTMIASYELAGGWMKVAPAKIGKRAFLGNSGMTGPGRSVPKNSLVAVLSATPAKAKSGTSWLGSPPVRLRRSKLDADQTLTFDPPLRLKIFRACWELCRAIPVVLTVGIAAGVLVALDLLAGSTGGYVAAAILGGVIVLAAGAVAAAASVAAKWSLVGRIEASEHPLWSSFIWRNEVVDTFVEMVTAPWFARSATGSPALVWWLRALGARIGSGSWCESYWLPEADLVTLGENSTVNRGCVIQTHLFHDRVMSMAAVTLEDGATIGPHGVILPAARIAAGGTVGPASLVMRGETVPAGSYWIGNPVSPWSVGPGGPGQVTMIG